MAVRTPDQHPGQRHTDKAALARRAEDREPQFYGARPGRRATARPLLYWLRWQFPVVLAVIGGFVVSYQARERSAHTTNTANARITFSARSSCRRGMSDRHDDMEDEYADYIAERATHPQQAATKLADVRDRMRRVDAEFSLTWPRGSKTYPLGLGTFSCIAAWPEPKKVRAPFWDVFG